MPKKIGIGDWMFWDLGISLMCFKCLENNSLVDCLEDSIRILDRFPGTFFFLKHPDGSWEDPSGIGGSMILKRWGGF